MKDGNFKIGLLISGGVFIGFGIHSLLSMKKGTPITLPDGVEGMSYPEEDALYNKAKKNIGITSIGLGSALLFFALNKAIYK